MKTKFTIFLLLTMAALIPASSTFAQVIVQHSGATVPESEGFYRSEFAAEVGPVFGDLGLDAWSFDAGGWGGGFYNYQVSPEEQQTAATQGWELSVRTRIVTSSFPDTSAIFGFGPQDQNFWISLQLGPDGAIRILDESNLDLIYTFAGAGNDYHEYSIIYDPIDEIAALWIAGIGHVGTISNGPVLPKGTVRFGALRGHTHWNEVTLTIVPEPATVTLLTGLGALLLGGAVRWRHHLIRAKA